MNDRALGWSDILRLGLVQTSLGAIVVLTTSTINRVMVVELALPAFVPGALVAMHYAVQMLRPAWGYGSDVGRTAYALDHRRHGRAGARRRRRGDRHGMDRDRPLVGPAACGAFVPDVGVGVGAAARPCWRCSPPCPADAPARGGDHRLGDDDRRLRDDRGARGAFARSLFPATPGRSDGRRLGHRLRRGDARGFRRRAAPRAIVCRERRARRAQAISQRFSRKCGPNRAARRFTIFIFVSMLAYSAQELMLEPFAGLVFGMSPGETTKLSGVQHGGVLVGMICVAVAGSAIGGPVLGSLQVVDRRRLSCLRAALLALAVSGLAGPHWPLRAAVFALGVSNGVFAVAAIGSMMGLAGAGAGLARAPAWDCGARRRRSRSASADFLARSASARASGLPRRRRPPMPSSLSPRRAVCRRGGARQSHVASSARGFGL